MFSQCRNLLKYLQLINCMHHFQTVSYSYLFNPIALMLLIELGKGELDVCDKIQLKVTRASKENNKAPFATVF